MAKVTKITSFEEDNFDLYEYRKSANATAREQSRVNSIRRQIFVGKVILAIVALSIAVLLYYVITVTVPIF